MRSKALNSEEQAAYEALAKAAARLREVQERAEGQRQADPAANRDRQTPGNAEGRRDG